MFTWPALIVPEADVTAAVSVIVLPVVMFAALPEAAVTVKAVVVTAPVAAAAVAVKLDSQWVTAVITFVTYGRTLQ